MNKRDEIIDSFTRTLFVEAYAAFVDDLASDGEDTDDMPQAHGGEDWMDAAPVTPDWVTPVALVKLAAIEAHLGESVESLYSRASAHCAGQLPKCNRSRHTADQFGYCLAMQYVGHGVAWSDDHARELDLPDGDSIHLGSRTDCGLPEVEEEEEEDTTGGYTDCACRDCFEVAIGKPGVALCHGCEEAGCEACKETECSRPGAYGCDDQEGE
jgi:hypothetical protein